MADYPPLSHLLAAIVALVAPSSLIAMHYLSWFAIICIYGVILGALWKDWSSTPLTYGLFVIGVACLQSVRMTFGHEIIDNFFYAQLIATAVALPLIAAVLRMPPGYWRTALAIAIIVLLSYTFNLVALQFAAAVLFGLLMRLDWRVDSILRFLAMALTMLVAIVTPPTFVAMVSNASYEGYFAGDINLHWFAASAFLIMLLAFWSRRRAPSSRGEEFVIACAGGYSSLALLQYLADRFAGVGTPYAVMKYAMGVGTMGLSLIILHVRNAAPQLSISVSNRYQSAMIAAVIVTTIAVMTRPWQGWNLHAYSHYAQEVIDLKVSEGARDLLGKTISVDERWNAAQNFTIALVVMRATYETGYDQLRAFRFPLDGRPADPRATYAIVHATQSFPASCRISEHGSLALVKRDCWQPS